MIGKGIAHYQLKPGRQSMAGKTVTANMLRRRVTRFRDWKGRHGDRRVLASVRAIYQGIIDDLDTERAGPRRPLWLRHRVERDLGQKVADAWIDKGVVTVKLLGKLETVAVTVNFQR